MSMFAVPPMSLVKWPLSVPRRSSPRSEGVIPAGSCLLHVQPPDSGKRPLPQEREP